MKDHFSRIGNAFAQRFNCPRDTIDSLAVRLDLPRWRVKDAVDALQSAGQITCANNIWRWGP